MTTPRLVETELQDPTLYLATCIAVAHWIGDDSEKILEIIGRS